MGLDRQKIANTICMMMTMCAEKLPDLHVCNLDASSRGVCVILGGCRMARKGLTTVTDGKPSRISGQSMKVESYQYNFSLPDHWVEIRAKIRCMLGLISTVFPNRISRL